MPKCESYGCEEHGEPRRYFDIRTESMVKNRNLCDACYDDIQKIEVDEDFTVVIKFLPRNITHKKLL